MDSYIRNMTASQGNWQPLWTGFWSSWPFMKCHQKSSLIFKNGHSWHIFSGKACDGLCGLLTFNGFEWNTIKGFHRPCVPLSDTLQAGAWLFRLYRKWTDHPGGGGSRGQVLANGKCHSKQANTRSFPSVPAFGSIRVVGSGSHGETVF